MAWFGEIDDVKLSVVDTDGLHPPAEVRALAHAAGRLLPDRRGVVMCFGGDSLELVALYLASLAAGHVVLLMPAHLAVDQRLKLIDAYSPEVVITRNHLAALHTAAAANGRIIQSTTEFGRLALTTFQASEAPAPFEDRAVLISTSGSTGSPKTVQLSSRALAANACAIATSLNLDDAEVAALGLPLCYSFGLSVLNSHLLVGASLLLVDKPAWWGATWQLIRQARATSFSHVASTYQRLMSADNLEEQLGPTITTLTQAGGPMSPSIALELANTMHRRGGHLYLMYGQTEATARISCLDAELLLERPGSVGRPIPGVTLTTDPSVQLPPSATRRPGPLTMSCGEILVQSPALMLGYAHARRDLAVRASSPSILRTGDLGSIDVDGFLYLHGRRSRYVKLRSQRILLDDVEAACGAHAQVAAVVSEDGERLIVFTTAVLGGTAYQEVQQHLRHELPRWSLPRECLQLISIDEIPTLPNGKHDHAGLARYAAEEADGGRTHV